MGLDFSILLLWFGALILFVVLALLYFVPAYVAYKRNHKNKGPIFLLNLLLGWTGIVWIGVLVWALVDEKTASSAGE